MELYSPTWEHDIGKERRSSSLSRRNSHVWLASAVIDSQSAMGSPQSSFSWGPPRRSHAIHDGPPTGASLDAMPIEILTIILRYVLASESGPRDLCRLVATCGRIYDLGIAMLYRYVVFRTPHAFDKFRWSIENTGYGQHVRSFDFSAFTSVGLGRTKRMNWEINMVTAKTLLSGLEMCNNLVEFLGSESIDTDLSGPVLDRLLSMPLLQSLDFCGSTDPAFVAGLRNSLVMAPDYGLYTLTRLSLHACSTIPSPVLARWLSKSHNLTRLDLTHTQVTDEALDSIPESAQLTHLSLSRCTKVSSQTFVRFLVVHPACKKLRWLNLRFEATKPVPINYRDTQTILRFLPRHMTYLNLYGLTLRDEDLALIDTQNLKSLWLGYTEVTLLALERFLPTCPTLHYLNLSGLPTVTSGALQVSNLLNLCKTIDMFEFNPEILTRLEAVRIPGFFVYRGRGRRGWLFRSKVPGVVREESRTDLRQVTFSFGQFALDRINAQRAQKQPVTVKPAHLEAPPASWNPIWRFASQKLNVSQIAIEFVASPAIYGDEGMYNYYSYHNI